MKTGIFLTAILLMGLASCKKSVTSKAPATLSELEGYWYGTFSAGNEGQVFKSTGATIQYDFYGTSSTDTATAPYKGTGTFTLRNDSIFFNLSYPAPNNETFTEKAMINTSVAPCTITGTYTGSRSGSFSLTKQ